MRFRFWWRNWAISRNLRLAAVGVVVGASSLLACKGHCPSGFKADGDVCRFEARDASVDAGASDASDPVGTTRSSSMREDAASDRDGPISKADAGGEDRAGAAGSSPKNAGEGGSGPSADGGSSGSAATPAGSAGTPAPNTAMSGSVGSAGCQSSAEECDNRDNDCDGTIDEALMEDCGGSTAGAGVCKHGTHTCSQGQWGDCTGETKPGQEVCDDKMQDEDCDGTVDNGCPCTTGQTRECGNPPSCKKGTQTCTNGVCGGQSVSARSGGVPRFAMGWTTTATEAPTKAPHAGAPLPSAPAQPDVSLACPMRLAVR